MSCSFSSLTQSYRKRRVLLFLFLVLLKLSVVDSNNLKELPLSTYYDDTNNNFMRDNRLRGGGGQTVLCNNFKIQQLEKKRQLSKKTFIPKMKDTNKIKTIKTKNKSKSFEAKTKHLVVGSKKKTASQVSGSSNGKNNTQTINLNTKMNVDDNIKTQEIGSSKEPLLIISRTSNSGNSSSSSNMMTLLQNDCKRNQKKNSRKKKTIAEKKNSKK